MIRGLVIKGKVGIKKQRRKLSPFRLVIGSLSGADEEERYVKDVNKADTRGRGVSYGELREGQKDQAKESKSGASRG